MSYQREMAIISLICNLEATSEILERVFGVLKREGINVKMMSQVRSMVYGFTADINLCRCLPIEPLTIRWISLVRCQSAPVRFGGSTPVSGATGTFVVAPSCSAFIAQPCKVQQFVLLQGASKTNISLIVANCEAERAVKGLHHEFFERTQDVV